MGFMMGEKPVRIRLDVEEIATLGRQQESPIPEVRLPDVAADSVAPSISYPTNARRD
jgi:hypothetical protein